MKNKWSCYLIIIYQLLSFKLSLGMRCREKRKIVLSSIAIRIPTINSNAIING